jgi:cytochrome b561
MISSACPGLYSVDLQTFYVELVIAPDAHKWNCLRALNGLHTNWNWLFVILSLLHGSCSDYHTYMCIDCQELMKSAGSHGSPSLLFMTKVMV